MFFIGEAYLCHPTLMSDWRQRFPPFVETEVN